MQIDLNQFLTYFLSISYWAWFGTLYLIILTYQDFKHNKQVDERKNFFMMGITMSLISHIPQKLWYILVLLVIVITLNYFITKLKVMGEGDAQALIWIFYGLGIINIGYLITFILCFGLAAAAYMAAKIWILKSKDKSAFFGVILILYVAFMFIFGLY